MKSQYNFMFQENEKRRRLSGQTMFESQLQTSMRNASIMKDEEEEDKVANNMSSVYERKLL